MFFFHSFFHHSSWDFCLSYANRCALSPPSAYTARAKKEKQKKCPAYGRSRRRRSEVAELAEQQKIRKEGSNAAIQTWEH